jgi:hypothetical protein
LIFLFEKSNMHTLFSRRTTSWSRVPESLGSFLYSGKVHLSGLLAGKIWQSNLHPDLKPLAAALADIGNDDGTSIYPSVAYMAWLLGRSTRAVQDSLSKLRKLGVLITVSGGRGGRHKSTEYRLSEADLPKRDSWKTTQLVRGLQKETTQFATQNHAVYDIKPRSLRHKTTKPTSYKPLVTVSRTVSEPQADAIVASFDTPEDHFDEFWKAYPKRVGKVTAKKAWAKTGANECFLEVISGVEKWKASVQWSESQFIPYPSTFLNGRRWEDEVPLNGGRKNGRPGDSAEEQTARISRNLKAAGLDS